MTPLEDIRAELSARADSTYLASIQRLVPNVKSIGVRVPQLKALAAEFHRKLSPNFSDESLWALMDALCDSKVRDQILFGVFLIARRRKALVPWARLERWLKAIDNWETCDQLATNVIASRVAHQPTLEPQLLQWGRSSSLWIRRIAVATSVGLNQRGRSNPGLALKVCEPLLADPELMVRKAVGWALREASERDSKQVFELLKRNVRNCHPTVLREGSQKLSDKARRALLG